VSRPLIFLVLALALTTVLLFTVDPLGLFVDDAIDRDPASSVDVEMIDDPTLAGRTGAAVPPEGTILRSTEPLGILDLGLGTAAILGTMGLLAGYFPARRAASIDPAETLRYE